MKHDAEGDMLGDHRCGYGNAPIAMQNTLGIALRIPFFGQGLCRAINIVGRAWPRPSPTVLSIAMQNTLGIALQNTRAIALPISPMCPTNFCTFIPKKNIHIRPVSNDGESTSKPRKKSRSNSHKVPMIETATR